MSKKLYVGNLPFKCDDEELYNMFSPFGEIESASIVMDKGDQTKPPRSKGFGFVVFKKESDADGAIAELNGTDKDGRKLTVNEAQDRRKDGYSPRSSNSDRSGGYSPRGDSPRHNNHNKGG